ncbi:MAG: histidinol-phosphate transaminase [Proteocatella sp.]
MNQVQHGADTKAIKLKYNLDEITDYSSNVNIFTPSGVDEILRTITSKDLNYYLDLHYIELREKIGKRYGFEKENVVAGNGSTEIMFLIMKLNYIKNIGIINPTFGEYERAANLAGKNIVDLYYDDEFKIDKSEVENIKDLDLLIICNPNNPSGNINELHEILEICKKNNTILMVDETFIEFVENGEEYSLINKVKTYENLIVIRAVTKFYSLTNIRLGYAFSSRNIIAELWNIKEPWTINIFAEKLADVIFDEEFSIKSRLYYAKEIARFSNKLSTLENIEVYPTKTNFILIKLPEDKAASKVKEELVKKYGILIRDCSNFKKLDGSYIRINIKDSVQNDYFFECFKNIIL